VGEFLFAKKGLDVKGLINIEQQLCKSGRWHNVTCLEWKHALKKMDYLIVICG
jgi:hypothetical protein